MLIPRDFALSSKAFSRIWDDKGSWKLVFLFPCHSVKIYCELCFRLFNKLTKPWVVWSLSVSPLCFPECPSCSLLSSHTVLLPSLHVYSAPSFPQAFAHALYFIFSHFTLLIPTYPQQLSSKTFVLFEAFFEIPNVKESGYVHVCICVCMLLEIDFPCTSISHLLCTFHSFYFTFVL